MGNVYSKTSIKSLRCLEKISTTHLFGKSIDFHVDLENFFFQIWVTRQQTPLSGALWQLCTRLSCSSMMQRSLVLLGRVAGGQGAGTRLLSTSPALLQDQAFKLVIVGGGAGGCGTANKFASKLGAGEVAVIEPNDMHYYQPMWTLVGGGLKDLQQSGRPMADCLPK